MNSNNRLNQFQDIKDYGNDPFIVNIDCSTKRNRFYRTALWTGDHLQVTLMSIPVGGDIGLEIHNNLYHICEFAERMERIGATYKPVEE